MLAALLRLIDGHSKVAHETLTLTPSVTRPARSDAFAAVVAHARQAREELAHSGERLEELCHPALAEAHCLVQAIARAATLCTAKEPRSSRS